MKASEAHKRQSKSIDAHIKFMGETELKNTLRMNLMNNLIMFC